MGRELEHARNMQKIGLTIPSNKERKYSKLTPTSLLFKVCPILQEFWLLEHVRPLDQGISMQLFHLF